MTPPLSPSAFAAAQQAASLRANHAAARPSPVYLHIRQEMKALEGIKEVSSHLMALSYGDESFTSVDSTWQSVYNVVQQQHSSVTPWHFLVCLPPPAPLQKNPMLFSCAAASGSPPAGAQEETMEEMEDAFRLLCFSAPPQSSRDLASLSGARANHAQFPLLREMLQQHKIVEIATDLLGPKERAYHHYVIQLDYQAVNVLDDAVQRTLGKVHDFLLSIYRQPQNLGPFIYSSNPYDRQGFEEQSAAAYINQRGLSAPCGPSSASSAASSDWQSSMHMTAPQQQQQYYQQQQQQRPALLCSSLPTQEGSRMSPSTPQSSAMWPSQGAHSQPAPPLPSREMVAQHLKFFRALIHQLTSQTSLLIASSSTTAFQEQQQQEQAPAAALQQRQQQQQHPFRPPLTEEQAVKVISCALKLFDLLSTDGRRWVGTQDDAMIFVTLFDALPSGFPDRHEEAWELRSKVLEASQGQAIFREDHRQFATVDNSNVWRLTVDQLVDGLMALNSSAYTLPAATTTPARPTALTVKQQEEKHVQHRYSTRARNYQ